MYACMQACDVCMEYVYQLGTKKISPLPNQEPHFSSSLDENHFSTHICIHVFLVSAFGTANPLKKTSLPFHT